MLIRSQNVKKHKRIDPCQTPQKHQPVPTQNFMKKQGEFKTCSTSRRQVHSCWHRGKMLNFIIKKAEKVPTLQNRCFIIHQLIHMENPGQSHLEEMSQSSDFVPSNSFSESREDVVVKRKKKKSKSKNIPGNKEGRWGITEEKVYVEFLEEYEGLFDNEHSRRSHKVFDQLSKLLRNSRTPDQCRSHHHKMRKKTNFSNIRSIIAYIRNKYREKWVKMGGSEALCSIKTEENIIMVQEKSNYAYEVHLENGILMKVSLNLPFLRKW